MKPSRAPKVAVASLALLLGACAWSNRDNRPVWNAFEEHLVPEDDAAFVATLPLTFPGGILAILVDTFVVHPAQIVDDAAGDARDVWDDMRWRAEYYTELVKIPFRTVGTPIVFVGSFIGRSAFDIEPYGNGHASRDHAEVPGARERQVREWFDGLAAGGTQSLAGHRTPGLVWNDDLQRSFEIARAGASGEGRLMLYQRARENRWPPWRAEPTLGFRDLDPVVRYRLLESFPYDEDMPRAMQDELRNDSNEMVRLLARRRFPARGTASTR